MTLRVGSTTWVSAWQNQQNYVRPAKTQVGRLPSLISLCCPHVETMDPWLPIECTAKALIRLHRCTAWSESMLLTHAILLVLSCDGSNMDCIFQRQGSDRRRTSVLVSIKVKILKFGHPKNCCNYPKIWTMSFYRIVMCPRDADRMADSVVPDQTSPSGAVWARSTLSTKTCLSKCLASLWYL